jgi:hypothetical protein
MDAAHAGDHLGNVGQPFILPSSHIGSPQSMFQFCQDSYAIAAAFGPKPDLFITATANPQWEDIQVALLPGQIGVIILILLHSVFHLKMEALLDEITKKGIFGRQWPISIPLSSRSVASPICTSSFFLMLLPNQLHQLKLTPLFVLSSLIQLLSPLYNIVSKVMIHRPCGVHGNPNAVCIDRGKCTKGFPKPFSDETLMTADGYPTYCRRNTGPHDIHAGGWVNSIDNRWVVPYNRYLSGCYECHINVEVCISVRATKYIHKYIFKGHDRITAVMQQDEIKQYLDARWLGDAEAMYCIFHFHTHKEWPPVERLPIHLPDEQMGVYDPARDSTDEVIQRIAAKDTKLLASLS